MNKFVKGFLAGTTFSVAVIAGIAFGVKKVVIEPIEDKELQYEENRKRANRKSFAR